MTWWTILFWLLQTIGPYLLELLIEWIKKHQNQLAMIPEGDQYAKAMQTLPADVCVAPRAFKMAKKLVIKYPEKMPQIMEKIQREKAKLGDSSQR